jgi:hypothetical protein
MFNLLVIAGYIYEQSCIGNEEEIERVIRRTWSERAGIG